MSSTESNININTFMIQRMRDEQIIINNKINQLTEVVSKLQESLNNINESICELSLGTTSVSKKSIYYDYKKLMNSLIEESILMKLAIHGYENFRGDEFGSVEPEQIINSSAGFDEWVLEGMRIHDKDLTDCLKLFLRGLR